MTNLCIDLDMLASYFGDKLSDEDKNRMMKHLTECPVCLESFASASSVMKNNSLDKWEPVSEQAAQTALKKLGYQTDTPVPENKGIIPALKEKTVRWVKGLVSEDYLLEYGFARAPNESSADHIHMEKIFGNLHSKIFFEKYDDKFCFQIRVTTDNKNVRVTLKRQGGGPVSRLLKDGYRLFEDLPFGTYHLIIAPKNSDKTEYCFEVNEAGIDEK
ncbi:MAG: hypothetical protein GY749_01095 [Desulfobacteraceae bacterium]|nr:hypothetical protein [Desulfobacteraceae bacterium]